LADIFADKAKKQRNIVKAIIVSNTLFKIRTTFGSSLSEVATDAPNMREFGDDFWRDFKNLACVMKFADGLNLTSKF
jgi:hypothetical protein